MLFIINYFILFLFTIVYADTYSGLARYNSFPLSTTKCAFNDNAFKFYAAVGPSNFVDTYSCGLCAVIKNRLSQQSIQVTIVDQCLGCNPTDIVMDRDSFSKIGDLSLGFIEVDWAFSPCPVLGTVEYYWVYPPNVKTIALLVTNLAVPVKDVVIDVNGSTIPFKRLNFNLFGGLPLGEGGKINIKMTSIFNEVIYESIPVNANTKITSKSQFSVTYTKPLLNTLPSLPLPIQQNLNSSLNIPRPLG
ncbi:hypothetical protein K502DRAFT_350956 [Neoconidiobolus thromboides FSU 785]|nr:hypothetical protein K502DRAFT_350956 [Neoconidiobolus thromboides FSU 785]